MSLITASTGLAAARTAIQIAAWASKGGPKPLELPPLDIYKQLDFDSLEDVVVSKEQAEQIEEFCEDPAITALLRYRFVKSLAPKEDAEHLSGVADMAAFKRLASTWCAERSQEWYSLTDTVWRSLIYVQDELLDRLTVSRNLDEDARNSLVDRFFFRSLSHRSIPDWVQVIEQLSRDADRQRRLHGFLEEANRITQDHAPDTFLLQGLARESVKYRDLYVDRTLTDATTGETLDAKKRLNIWAAAPRAVIVGDPGVGKTTLTGWMRWNFMSAHEGGLAPLMVTLVCRNSLHAPGTTLIAALRQQLEGDFASPIATETLLDLLATGWLVPVIDGIDEILDSGQRTAVVNQLNTFVERYPLTSIICTTRRTGFEVSLFSTSSFQLYNLEQYTELQVVDYVDKWFAQYPEESRTERFLGESRALDDLRRNPLMLALLCTLFQSSDYIPQSRREVYLRCAALMFREWDPRRGIAIPNIAKKEGDAILREIALILYQGSGMTTSLEESQVQKIVSDYLISRGEESMAATAATGELIDYCSGRAWILSKVTSPNSRVSKFSFTHRTFYEFFAAEGIVRKVNRANALQNHPQPAMNTRLGPMSREIVEAYAKDSSSVMPELLLQAADDIMGGVSSTILEEVRLEALRRRGAGQADLITLAVRLIASAGIGETIANRVFDAMFQEWLTPNSVMKMDQFRSTLDVASGHRSRLITRVSLNEEEALAFVSRYARVTFLGEGGLFSEDWKAAAEMLCRSLPVTDLRKDTLRTWLAWHLGVLPSDAAILNMSGRSLIELSFGNVARSGPLWSSLADAPDASSQRQRARAWQWATSTLIKKDVAEHYTSLSEYDTSPWVDSLLSATSDSLPIELLINIGLIVGPNGDHRLRKYAPRRDSLAFIDNVRMFRDSLDFLIEEDLDGDDVRDVREIMSAHLDDTYGDIAGTPCPTWIKQFIGLARRSPDDNS